MFKRFLNVISICLLLVVFPYNSLAKEEKKNRTDHKIDIPSFVVNIAKENTHSNISEDLPQLKPSDFTRELLETANEPIQNPQLIKLLNESSSNKSPFAIGLRAKIYIGEFPLHYRSEESYPNWQFQKINTNIYDNSSGEGNHQIHYVQQAHKRVRGGLTTKVPQPEDVLNMMVLTAMEKTKLPLTMDYSIGAGTRHHQVYNVNPNKVGHLTAYVPALVEKGEVTYGEVYLVFKGSKPKIEIKNVTSQKVGAWILIRDHVTLTFHTKP